MVDHYSHQQHDYSGKFIVLEGIDCCGKDTQLLKVKDRLVELGIDVTITNEPTYKGIGKFIRENLNNGLKDVSMDDLSTLYIMDRKNHYQKINEDLQKGKIVICSRYIHSNMAYNTDGSLEELSEIINKNLQEKIGLPDKLIYLDITPEESIKRLTNSRNNLDVFENLEKQKKVHDNYEIILKNFKLSGSVKCIDGTSDRKIITSQIVDYILSDE